MAVNIPVGISKFSEIRQNGYYYIDKTGLIKELLKAGGTKATLITRPRRFGKTLAMRMLADFFDIEKNSSELFEGLEICNYPEMCSQWMNRYPTVFISMKDIGGLNFQDAYDQLTLELCNLYGQYEFLQNDDALNDDDKKIFSEIKERNADKANLSRGLSSLLRMLHKHYKRPVILLIDEYDVPVAKAGSNGYYGEMLELIKLMLGTALKDNSDLKFAVITGCLKIVKESIFTGLNNLVSDTISSSRFNEYFGFTQNEVDRLLEDAGMTARADDIKAWYDGYCFGNSEIYCPWDVMNYVRDLQHDPDTRPAGYWKNTSDNAIIRSFIDYSGASITKKLETLLSGGYIIQKIDEEITYDYLHSSEDNLWSIMYLTGYLTKVKDELINQMIPDGFSALKIPNSEIKEIFQTTIIKWFNESAETWNRQDLFNSVWSADSEKLTEEMTALLRKTISYHDYKEDFYHAFLAGIFAGAGYQVESNKEHGEGRSDVVVSDPVNARIAIFEVKYSKAMDKMESDCEAALHQIDKRLYAEEYRDDYDTIICYGISFFKKRCLVKKK